MLKFSKNHTENNQNLNQFNQSAGGSGNITIDGLKISATDTGATQKIFKTITVGSTSFSAGSNTDTLTFAAGTGMTITPDTTNKKLTLTASGSDLNVSGWTDDGTVVRLSTSTDKVGIGTTNPLTELDIAGSASLSANLFLRGLGTAHTFNILDNGTLNIQRSPGGDAGLATALFVQGDGNIGIGTTIPSSKLQIAGDILPDANGTRSLGSSSLVWSNIYANNITPGSSGTVGYFQRNSSAISPANITDDLLLGATSTSSAKFAFLNVAGGTPTASISATTTGVVIGGDGTIQSLRAGNLTLGGSTTGNVLINPRNGTAGGFFAPVTDNVTDLGASSSARFRKLYLGPSSAHVLCTTGDGCGQTLDYSLGVNTSSGNFQFGVNAPSGNNSSPAFIVTQGGNVGVGTTSASFKFDVNGTLGVSGATTFAPTVSGVTTMTLRASTASPGNILNITNAAGSSSYLSVDSSGSLTIGGSTLTNAGLLASSGAIHLTNSANALVGTAIEGGWTMNSNAYTYRKPVTVVNNDGSNSLPSNYEISLTLSGNHSSHIYSNSQSDNDDFRIAYLSGGSYTELARNVTTFSSSSIVFTFQLQSAIAASGSDANYYIFYKNSSLTAGSTYTGNVQLDAMDAVSSWTSADTTQFPIADETTIKQEGTGSIKMSGTVDNIGTFSTTSQNALSGARTNFGFTNNAISGTTYLYAVGGSTDGTAGNAQTTVLRTSVAAATGHVAAWTTNSNSLSAAVMDNSVSIAAAVFDGGTGADGTLDLSLGSGAGGCNGTGLSWSGSTCTIATATKSTFNFTTINVSSGTTLTTNGPSDTSNFVTIKATGNVTVAGTINLAGKGYSGGSYAVNGYGPGGAPYAAVYKGGAGGGYGGSGGDSASVNGSSGGSTYSTDDSGSGGGCYCGGGPVAGAGGGGINISSGGTITVSGTINTNGGTATPDYNNAGGGGGSGGRIYLKASTVDVSNSTLSANGGGGGTASGYMGGSGGGGGRITLEYSSSLTTTGSTVTVTGGAGGVGDGTGNSGNAGVSNQATLSSNMYVLGGKNTSGTAQSGISKSAISSSDGSAGAFSASSVSLPQALFGHTSNVVTIGSSNYLYIVGGNNGTSDQTTVYKGTFDSNGISAISTTSQTQLGTGISYHATVTGSISSTNYIWVLGGLNGSTAQTSVYRGTIDSSGNVTALSTTSQGALPQGLYGHKAVFATVGSNNYIFAYGGMTTGGTRQTTVYKAPVDSSGNVGTWTTTGQTQLSTAISDFGAFNFTDSSSNQYAYIVGGNTGTVQTAVSKTMYSPIDQTGYSMSRTISSVSLSNKNDLQYKVYSSRTGSYMVLEYSEDGSTWQTCTFSVSSASTWETKTCDMTGVSSANRDGVTRLRTRVTSSTTTAWTAYIDDLNAVTNASTISNTASNGNSVFGASNLTVNGQGTGSVNLNYDANSGLAGTGGMKVYDGSAGLIFNLTSTGDASAAGALVLNGASASARLNILDGKNFAIQTSAGGDAGLTSRLFMQNNGNIGIGTTSPLAVLDIRGNLGTVPAASISAISSFASLLADNSGVGDLFTASKSGTTKFVVLNNGNLRFAGTTNFLTTLASSATAARTITFPDVTGTLCTSAANCAFDAFWNTSSGALYSGNATTDLLIGGTSTASAKFGFINIAGGNPTATISGNLSLVVPTTAGANTFNLLNNGTLNFQRSPGGDGDLASNSVLFLGNNGNVGIGTTAPGLRLDVQDSQSATAAAQIYNTNTGTDADGLVIKLGNTSTTAVSTTNHFVSFETFGIGIVGSIQGSGGKGVTYATGGIADFAEYFKKDQNSNIPFGSVVCFDNNGLAVACDNSSNKIIGVASERPAFLGGENLGDKSVAVGLVGQVRTRVSTANGAIKIGDPLTTSSIAGVAVKATQTGQILGKAIEAYDGPTNETGEILVSVNIGWYNPSIYVSYDGTLAGMAETVASIGDQLALQGETLQAQAGTISATSNAVSALELKLSLLSEKVDQQASISALLLDIQNQAVLGASTSAELDLGDIELRSTTISGDLMVLGRTTMSDLGVTGNINAGLLSIHGLNGEINTLGGDLYLQRNEIGGINMLNGKVVVDIKGNMVIVGELTAKKINIDVADTASSSLGESAIKEGQAYVIVETTAITDKSKVFITATAPTGGNELYVSEISASAYFKVSIENKYSKDIKFNWWIVN